MNVKKILCMLLSLCMIFMAASTYSWASEEGCIYGAEQEAGRGETICYPIMIKNNPGIASTLISVTCESEDITIAETADGKPKVELSHRFSEGNMVCSKMPKGCKIAWFGDENNYSDGTLFYVYLNVSESAAYGEYAIKVSCQGDGTVNEDEQNVLLKCKDGKIIISDPSPTIYGEKIKIKSGETIDYDISIKNNPGVCSIALYMEINTSGETLDVLLDEEGEPIISQGDFSSKGSVMASKYKNGWKLLWYTTGNNQTGDGSVFSIRLKAADNAESEACPIIISTLPENVVDEDGARVDIPRIENGFADIRHVRCGDVDENGRVDFADVFWLKRAIAGWDGYGNIDSTISDVNKDGAINLDDLLILEKHVAGWKEYETLPKIN